MMGTATTPARPPFPPFTRDSAIQKVRLAEDAWNTRDPTKVAQEKGEHLFANSETRESMSIDEIPPRKGRGVSSDLDFQNATFARETAADESIHLSLEWERYFGVICVIADAVREYFVPDEPEDDQPDEGHWEGLKLRRQKPDPN